MAGASTPGGNSSDVDGDGLANTIDPFSRDATNGGGTVISAGNSLNFGFDGNSNNGPVGFGGGLTGVAVNGVTDFEQSLNLNNVGFNTGNGGAVDINNVSNGDAFINNNSGEFLFQTGVTVANNVNTLNIQWQISSPGGDALGTNFQQLGGFIGTGDQANYLKFVEISHPEGEFELVLEDGDAIESQSYIQADDLFDLPPGTQVFLNLSIDVNSGIATPTASYNNTSLTGANIDLSGTAVLDAIRGDHTINGQSSGLAIGLYSTNTGASPDDTFSAVFHNVNVSAT